MNSTVLSFCVHIFITEQHRISFRPELSVIIVTLLAIYRGRLFSQHWVNLHVVCFV